MLTYVWDPVGVREVPQARDEYRSYLPQVFRRVLEAKEPGSIADYLITVESESMGFTPNNASRDEALRIAKLLIEHRDWIAQMHPDQ